MTDDNYYMTQALHEALTASQRGDVPVGAIIVRNREILARASDVKSCDPTAHAEIVAIRECSGKLSGWNLSGCTLYVTLEPCPMCAGACVNARVSRVVYGARNFRSGAGGTLYNILRDSRLNHMCEITAGIMENECVRILQDYFIRRRQKCFRHA